MDPDYDEVYTAVAKGRGLMLVDANGKGIPLTVSRIEEALSWLSEQPTPALLHGWQLLLGAVETDICVAVIRFAPRTRHAGLASGAGRDTSSTRCVGRRDR